MLLFWLCLSPAQTCLIRFSPRESKQGERFCEATSVTAASSLRPLQNGGQWQISWSSLQRLWISVDLFTCLDKLGLEKSFNGAWHRNGTLIAAAPQGGPVDSRQHSPLTASYKQPLPAWINGLASATKGTTNASNQNPKPKHGWRRWHRSWFHKNHSSFIAMRENVYKHLSSSFTDPYVFNQLRTNTSFKKSMPFKFGLAKSPNHRERNANWSRGLF